MKLHITTANGKTQVSDAATGAVLDWVQSLDVTLDPNGTPWLYLGTSAFDANFAIQSPAPPLQEAPPVVRATGTITPVPTPAPTPAPTATPAQ